MNKNCSTFNPLAKLVEVAFHWSHGVRAAVEETKKEWCQRSQHSSVCNNICNNNNKKNDVFMPYSIHNKNERLTSSIAGKLPYSWLSPARSADACWLYQRKLIKMIVGRHW